jgi:hypothetical protein
MIAEPVPMVNHQGFDAFPEKGKASLFLDRVK